MTTETPPEGNDIEALRGHLFETIKALRDKANPMDIDRAKAISDVAQVIINSAKVEVEYLKANDGGESTFIAAVGRRNLPPGLPSPEPGDPPNGITGVRRHLLRG